jgi:hypothetical protein
LNGRIVADGGPGLAEELDVKGYDWVRSEFAPDEVIPGTEHEQPLAKGPAGIAVTRSLTGTVRE